MADLPDSPELTPVMRQEVRGDRNQIIGEISGGTVINQVETLNQITQQQARTIESARYALPLDAADFVGRGDEIRQIEADIKAGTVVAMATTVTLVPLLGQRPGRRGLGGPKSPQRLIWLSHQVP